MVRFENVGLRYGMGAEILKDISFSIEPQSFQFLTGPSGAGKTTLLRLILLSLQPTRGMIRLFGLDALTLDKPAITDLRRRIGVVFQDFRLLPTKTAYENVAFALEVAGRPQREIAELVPQVLDMVGLGDKMKNFPNELSGGERQRVAIARAMIHRPEVVIADEPTGNLDPFHTFEIVKLLEKINQLGTTVVLATHDKEVINNLERRVITLDKGRLIRDEKKGKYILV